MSSASLLSDLFQTRHTPCTHTPDQDVAFLYPCPAIIVERDFNKYRGENVISDFIFILVDLV